MKLTLQKVKKIAKETQKNSKKVEIKVSRADIEKYDRIALARKKTEKLFRAFS